MFNIKNLKFKYSKQYIIKNISMKFNTNKLTTILGINGAGKTTLIKSMMKLLKPSEGEVYIKETNIRKFKTKEFAREVAYVPQHITFPEGTTVFDFVAFGRNPHTNAVGSLNKSDVAKINESLKICKMFEYKDSLVQSLSGGQRQMCAIALTVAQDSEIILLDEPNSYLDIYNVDEIMNILTHLVKAHDKTIIMTTHDINQASKFSDFMIMMKNGKIHVHDKPKKVVTKENLAICYNVDATIKSINNKPVIVDYTRRKYEI